MTLTFQSGPQDPGGLEGLLNALRAQISALLVPSYGEITIDSNATATVMTTQNTWYPITPNWTSNVTPSGVTLDVGAGNMTVNTAGLFALLARISFTSPDGPETVEFGMFANGALVVDHLALTWLDTATFPNTVTITGIDPFAAGDVLDLRARCTTASGKSLTVTGANFSVFSIGLTSP